jgi:glycosyltransferase involved in cell wall biosynthesis
MHKDEKPLISIVLVVYNARDSVEQTILGVLDQDYSNIELIVIDGASNDGTLNILEKYKRSIQKLISEPDNGVYDAFNKGIKAAQGDWLYFIGAGDKFFKKTTISKVFSEPPQGKFLYGNVVKGSRAKPYDGKFYKLKYCRKNICHQSIFYHRDLFQQLGIFDTRYPLLADWAFNIKCFSSRGVNPTFIDIIIAAYEGGGISDRKYDTAFFNDLDKIFESFGEPYISFVKAYWNIRTKLGNRPFT